VDSSPITTADADDLRYSLSDSFTKPFAFRHYQFWVYLFTAPDALAFVTGTPSSDSTCSDAAYCR